MSTKNVLIGRTPGSATSILAWSALKRVMSQATGAAVEFFAKRDDGNSGLAFCGNKSRKLEQIVPDMDG